MGDDTYVRSFSQDIMKLPEYVSSSTKFYSEKQMLDMFRAGCMSISNTDFRLRVSKITVLRNMNIGDTISFPLNQWDYLRSTAYRLKKTFGSVYQINRKGQDVYVKRVQ